MLIPDKSTGDTYTAAEFTEFKNEVQNLILSTGISLASVSTQTKESVKRYAIAGDFYIDSGAADNYVLSKIGIYGTTSAYILGMRCRFVANATNTGASTVNVSGLGAITIKKDQWTTDLAAGDIVVGKLYEIVYDTVSGFFELIDHTSAGATITFVDTPIVVNQPVPLVWTSLDLSSAVGTNTALVLCRIQALGGFLDIMVRTLGDSQNIGAGINTEKGGGTTAASMIMNSKVYLLTKTDSSGIIEVAEGTSATNYSLDVVAYIK